MSYLFSPSFQLEEFEVKLMVDLNFHFHLLAEQLAEEQVEQQVEQQVERLAKLKSLEFEVVQ